MSELIEKNALWVDELGDNVEDFIMDEEFVVDEADTGIDDEQFVVEEPNEQFEQQCLIPGSDTAFVEDQAVEEKEPTDWAKDGDHSQFVSYVKDKISKIPRHTGETIPGCERAKSFLKSLDSEISKAMRTDLEGVIDEQEIDAMRKELEKMVDRLDMQIKKLKGTKKASLEVHLFSEGQCERCKSSAPVWHDVVNNKTVCMHCEAETLKAAESIEKTAGTPVLNVYISPFERAIVGILVNSSVSAGRNIEETYEKLKNKYNFTPREELAIQQLVSDYGYPVYKDRGLLNEPSDPAAGDGVEWLTNYQA